MTLERKLTVRRSAIAGGLAMALLIYPVKGKADDGRSCSDAMLKGTYGLVGTGTRPTPGQGTGTEVFATVATVTYDGNGGFTSKGTSHGSTTGVRATAASGTYHINDDCTGTSKTIIPIPGVPPIEDFFVIVDNGREIRTVTTTPGTVATANLRAK